MKDLEYPFDSEYILKKKKSIRKELLQDGTSRIQKRVAVLGGSTTHDIVKMLELFLLNYGIEPIFYESEYAMYWQDAVFGNEELDSFGPDIIYIHTSNRNITDYPNISDTKSIIEDKRKEIESHFVLMWNKLREKFACPIIQNNFEMPFYRLMGNREAYDIHGKIHFLNSLNNCFYNYAAEHDDFYINDINYISSCYGLDKWADPFYWHMYKYALCLPAIPQLAFNVANIIKSIYGKNKKALVLDLDNTLWGGIVGDDGVENLQIGPETSMGQVYSEFQEYIKAQKDLGVLLNINSKNEEKNALAGINHPDSKLNEEDFVVIKANWNPKSQNIFEIATELNIGEDSLVFVDDNPAEQEIVAQDNKGVAVPAIGSAEQYIRILDHSGFFEVTKLSEDDYKRNQMYKENIQRVRQEHKFSDYKEYLCSLNMHAVIRPFESMYMARIAQLTNKSNQFNLTTKRYSQSDIERMAMNSEYITLYGKLEDKFGDNGVVTVVIGKQSEDKLHMDLWLMSCRVLKRDMEYAMMNELVDICKSKNISGIYGYYYPTVKNAMVKDFYGLHGFTKVNEDAEGNSTWYIDVEKYQNKNTVIKVNG